MVYFDPSHPIRDTHCCDAEKNEAKSVKNDIAFA